MAMHAHAQQDVATHALVHACFYPLFALANLLADVARLFGGVGLGAIILWAITLQVAGLSAQHHNTHKQHMTPKRA